MITLPRRLAHLLLALALALGPALLASPSASAAPTERVTSTAERIKVELGCAYPQAEVIEMEISGRNLAEGVPKMISISSNEVLDALREPLAGIVAAILLF